MKRLIILLVIPLIFISCENLFESYLNKGPLDKLSETSYWQTGNDALYAVNGLYEGFFEFRKRGDGPAGPGGFPDYDATLDIFHYKDNWKMPMWGAGEGTWNANNDFVREFWDDKYKFIRNANFFFENIDRVRSSISEKDYNNYCGQARVVRAFLYFRLVQGFGDVPLVTNTLETTDWPGRDPAEQVMDFVFSEFDKAITELPEEQSDNLHGRINKDVARIYKARAALHYAGYYGKTGYYQIAYDALDPVVKSGKYELWNKNENPVMNYQEMFWTENEGQENKEMVFSFQFIKDKYPSNISTCFAGPGWKSHQVMQNFIDQFECKHGFQAHGISFKEMNEYRDTKALKSPLEGVCPDYDPFHEFEHRDPRLSATFMNGNPRLNKEGNIVRDGEFWEPGQYHIYQEWENDCYSMKKLVQPTNFNPEYYYGNSDNNFPLIRYADVLLLYAEVLNELDQTTEAVPYINKVRARADMPPVVSSDKAEVLEIIKHERKIELVNENHLIWDYKRWKEYERTMPYGAKFYGFRRETFGHESQLNHTKYLVFPKYNLWPIPQGELINNKNMTQNPEW
ncbi:MAG: RagB/SusD family nutrient uptake outer membrane protein [Dysgonamonadaceae bacterium]|nr:RagB/SusD family nutrient uptake outer membrane protein [Dysgonamonadaceae bacterium]